MRWALRFAAFATLFAVPAWLLGGPWQRALGAIAAWVLSGFGITIEMSEVQVLAPYDLGIFLAMCLASRRAPPLERRRAIEWGIPILIGLEILTVAGAVALYLSFANRSDESAIRAMTALLEFVPWASATTVWLLLLGRWELPAIASPAAERPRRGRGAAP